MADKKLNVVSKQTANFNRSEGMSVMENMLQANSAIQVYLHITMRWHLEQWKQLETRKSWWLVLMRPDDAVAAVKAGKMAATAGAGYAKNLRHDIFYKVQEFSFKKY